MNEPGAPGLHEALAGTDEEQLVAAARSPQLTEELALAALRRRDLPGRVIEALAANHAVGKSRPALNAVAGHPRTPRHVSVPLVRRLFTFELMNLSLAPATPGDIKRVVEDVLLARMETITTGERTTLARRATNRVAGELLLDADARVVEAALQNPRMTQAALLKALSSDACTRHLLDAVLATKWPMQPEVKNALQKRAAELSAERAQNSRPEEEEPQTNADER